MQIDDFKKTLTSSMFESHSFACFHGDPIGKFGAVWLHRKQVCGVIEHSAPDVGMYSKN